MMQIFATGTGTDLLSVGNSKSVAANRIVTRQDSFEHFYGLSDGSPTSNYGRFKLGTYSSGDGILAGTDSGYIILRRNTGHWSSVVGGDGVHFMVGGTSVNQTYTSGSASEVMTVGSNGNVGVGTTSPGAKLQIGTATLDASTRLFSTEETRKAL
jgi:hypothetical protein